MELRKEKDFSNVLQRPVRWALEGVSSLSLEAFKKRMSMLARSGPLRSPMTRRVSVSMKNATEDKEQPLKLTNYLNL